jgi:hypothetical protein
MSGAARKYEEAHNTCRERILGDPNVKNERVTANVT